MIIILLKLCFNTLKATLHLLYCLYDWMPSKRKKCGYPMFRGFPRAGDDGNRVLCQLKFLLYTRVCVRNLRTWEPIYSGLKNYYYSVQNLIRLIITTILTSLYVIILICHLEELLFERILHVN